LGQPDLAHRIVFICAWLNGRLTAASADGSGAVQLGLIIVQRTTEEVDCTIDMVTREGRGTRASVIIRA
jgi:hypothetical protein